VFGSAALVGVGATYGFFDFLSSILLLSPSTKLILFLSLALIFVACT
jgi:hypothetical protein